MFKLGKLISFIIGLKDVLPEVSVSLVTILEGIDDAAKLFPNAKEPDATLQKMIAFLKNYT